ncbi:hypothetical protein LXA43DRAFT_315510 [Ganoderma leucocontextum]|nr:hypothetical protein LXA43DRAFT_315510 [Ganoderma leucocontextum]
MSPFVTYLISICVVSRLIVLSNLASPASALIRLITVRLRKKRAKFPSMSRLFDNRETLAPPLLLQPDVLPILFPQGGRLAIRPPPQPRSPGRFYVKMWPNRPLNRHPS